MLTLTLLQGIIAVLITALLGFFIGQYFTKRKSGNWEAEYKTLETSYKDLNKVSKKDKKRLNQLNQQSESWQSKYNTLSAEYSPLPQEIDDLKLALNEKETDYNNLKNRGETDLKSITSKHERLEKEHEKLREKYSIDLKDSKGWKNLRERLTRTANDYKFKWERAEKEKAALQEKLDAQTEKIEEAVETRRQSRRLRNVNKKLEEDIKYWEKKHYDTHHELAESQDRIEALVDGLNEMEQLKKGGEIQQQNMLKKIEEYKAKFVNINNKYQALVGQQ